MSTFTITDTTGDLATFLSNPGYRKSPHRKNHTIFHIEVITTEGTLEDSKFYMRGDQIAKVRMRSHPVLFPADLLLFNLLIRGITHR
jgi:hypothetical protein